MTAKPPVRKLSSATSTVVADDPAPPVKLLNPCATPSNVSPHCPSWIWTSSVSEAPGLRDRTTSVWLPLAVNVAQPVWPESFSAPRGKAKSGIAVSIIAPDIGSGAGVSGGANVAAGGDVGAGSSPPHAAIKRGAMIAMTTRVAMVLNFNMP